MSRRDARLVVAALAAAGLVGGAVTPTGSTYAAWSDAVVVAGNVAGAGVWAPDPPAACGPLSDYAGVVHGTFGDDVLHGGNRPQVIMGLSGRDVLHGGNSGDCLVGGDGDDVLLGSSAKDVLLGGEGDDVLDGGNGKDVLDAGGDEGDTCLGGNGRNTVVDCDPVAATTTTSATPTVLTGGAS